jgi:hypothetical protein
MEMFNDVSYLFAECANFNIHFNIKYVTVAHCGNLCTSMYKECMT